jgi:hypothetical protein
MGGKEERCHRKALIAIGQQCTFQEPIADRDQSNVLVILKEHQQSNTATHLAMMYSLTYLQVAAHFLLLFVSCGIVFVRLVLVPLVWSRKR